MTHQRLASLCCILGSLVASQDAIAQSDWVVREVKAPMAPSPERNFAWSDQVIRMGDMDRDGYPEALVHAYSGLLPHGGDSNRWMEIVQGAGFRARYGEWVDPDKYRVSRPAVLLRWPGQVLLAVNRPGHGPTRLELWDIQTERRVGVASPPPPVNGLPIPNQYNRMTPAGDVNGDGFDDILWYGSNIDNEVDPPVQYGLIGLVDGALQETVWLRGIAHAQSVDSRRPFSEVSFQDVNDDGFLDPVISYIRVGNGRTQWLCLSGQDGSTLWSRSAATTQGFEFRYWAEFGDLDSDGFRDLVSMQPVYGPPVLHPGSLTAFSGRNGTAIWTFTLGELAPFFGRPGTPHDIGFDHMVAPYGDQNRDGIQDILLISNEGADWNDYDTYRSRVVCISGADGVLLGRETMPDGLGPWFPDNPLDNVSPQPSPLGDMDGDGWCELAVREVDTNSPDPRLPNEHFVVLGRRTLFVPEVVRPGGRYNLRLDLPGAAGMPFQVLLSTRFERTEGIFLGPWNTHLGVTRLTRACRLAPTLRGMLDADGYGGCRNDLPPNRALVGKTLYSVAVALDPASPGGVRTLSSLGITRVSP